MTCAGAGVEAGVAQEAGRGRHGRQLEGPPVGRLHHHVADAAGQARAWDKVAYTCIYTYLLLLPHYPQCPVPTKRLKWREGLGSVLLRQHVRPGPGRGEAVGGGQLGGVRPPRLHAARGEGLGHLRDHRLQEAGGQGGDDVGCRGGIVTCSRRSPVARILDWVLVLVLLLTRSWSGSGSAASPPSSLCPE